MVLDAHRDEITLEQLTAEMAGGQELDELSHELRGDDPGKVAAAEVATGRSRPGARPRAGGERRGPRRADEGQELRVGIIGVGMMGADHAERVANRIAGARLVAVSDPDTARARALAARYDGVRRSTIRSR